MVVDHDDHLNFTFPDKLHFAYCKDPPLLLWVTNGNQIWNLFTKGTQQPQSHCGVP